MLSQNPSHTGGTNMAQNKKKGPAPQKKTTVKHKKSTNQIIFSIIAVFMVLLMIVPYLTSLFN